jgi:hypothetical protein
MSRSLLLSLTVGALLPLLPTGASAATTARPAKGSSTCAPPPLAQVYRWAGDNRLYTGLPGERWDSMGNGSGWLLSGGAKLETAPLLDGTGGSVLDLPGKSEAISPPVCVTNDYPSARAEIRDIAGRTGVNVSVSYKTASGWRKPTLCSTLDGQGTKWSLAKRFSVVRGDVRRWHLVRFVLVPRGASSEYQLSNFYVDPRMHK